MPCEQPIPAWRPAIGGPLLFKPPTNGRAYNKMHVPCGHCILCRTEQARQTAVRIIHEATLHQENCFLTLTYDDNNIPTYGSLNYEHLVKFWKRLRKSMVAKTKANRSTATPIRYYAVGEYGDRSLRPHYHACLFGHAFLSERIILRTTPSLLWTSMELQRIWGHGNVSVGALNFATARYTASYITKKLRSKQQYVRVDNDTGELIAIEQPRAFMSRNLGKGWWDEWNQQLQDHDHVIIDAHPQKPPKAYDRWLLETNPEKMEEIKEQRKNNAIAQTEDQTHARARNAHARAEKKSKSI